MTNPNNTASEEWIMAAVKSATGFDDAKIAKWHDEIIAIGSAILAVAPTQGADARPVPWENLPCYLIDKCEGQVISEEFLQHALSEMLTDPQYSGAKPFELSQEFINAAKDGPDVMGFCADARPVAIYQVERLAREVEVECLAGSGVSFYMVAEMAIERTIEMLAGPSMQIAEVCQDADGFKHVESVIEDLDDLPAGMKLYATTQRNHG